MNGQFINYLQQNIWIKLGLAGFISLLLMIPTAHIEDLIQERHEFAQVVNKEIASKWSTNQIAGAVVLSVPYVRETDKLKANRSDLQVWLHFLPQDLKMDSVIESVVRSRGIYKVPLYVTKLSMSGDFENVSLDALKIKDAQILWEQAVLSVGVREVRGIKSALIKWDGQQVADEVGDMPADLVESAINAKLSDVKTLKARGAGQFTAEIELRGSEVLEFYPLGQITTVSVQSDWGDPSFEGAFLPESHVIEDKRFEAQWKVLGHSRNIPKAWEGEPDFYSEIANSKFGVSLHMSLQNYQLNNRMVKYSFLFIFLTFITMFFIEVINRLRFHPMHYAVIGSALVLFYLLLFSLSEHLGFESSYAIAASATVVTIAMYILGINSSVKGALIVFGELGVLYAFLFVLLKQEDHALVFGAIGLWLMLVTLMYVTRKIDWFNLSLSTSDKRERQ